MRRIIILLSIIFLSLGAVVFIYKNSSLLGIKKSAAEVGHCKDCNVILVSLDTLSAGHLPCYGYSRNTSINLCDYGSQNIFFSKVYANATWTLPGHVSMFTGMYPYLHGVLSYGDTISADSPFLMSQLKAAGYDTTFVSQKSDLTIPLKTIYGPYVDNFIDEDDKDSWLTGMGLFKDNIKNGKKSFLFLHTYDVHEPYLTGEDPLLYTSTTVPGIPTKLSEFDQSSKEYIDFISDYIKESKKDPAVDREMIENYEKIKAIIIAHRSSPSMLSSELEAYGFDAWYLSYLFNYRRKVNLEDPKTIDYIRALYDQKIYQMDDRRIADLLNFIKDPGIRDNTLIIITADHGEEFNEHGHISHETTYDSNLRIPLILSIPGVNGKLKIDKEVQSVDIMPTILDSLGMPIPKSVNGDSLLPLLNGKDLKERLLISDGFRLQNRVLRKNGFTLFIKKVNGNYVPYEFYDTTRDPEQHNNILISNIDKANSILNEYLNTTGVNK